MLTVNDYNENFVLNYLDHFWIINALLPLLKKASQRRILLAGALLLIVRYLKGEAPQPVPSTENYNGMAVTGQVVVGRLLLTQKLSKLLQVTKVTINVFHPENIPDSNYGSESSSFFLKMMGSLFARLSKKNPLIGAQLATDTALSQTTGAFFNESGKVVPFPKQLSMELADEWWKVSQTL